MTQVTIYQANHPETLPVMITEPELVLESELPDRLQTINSNISGLQTATTGIMYEPTIYETPATTFNQAIVVNGNVTAHNIDIIATKCTPLNYVNGILNINTPLDIIDNDITADNITDITNRVAGIQRIIMDPEVDSYTVIDGNDFPTVLGRITNTENTLTGISYTDMPTPITSISQDVTINGKLNGHLIGISGNNVNLPVDAPFLVSCKVDGVTEIGKHLDFHDTNEDFYARLQAVGNNVLEILGTSSFRASRFDTSIGFALRTDQTQQII